MAVAVFGLAPKDAWDLTMVEFAHIHVAHLVAQKNREQTTWEQVRWQTTTLVQVHMPKGKQLKYDSLISFDWERKQKRTVGEITVGEIWERSGMSKEQYDEKCDKIMAAILP